jgi:hypothetical protein
VAAGSLLDQSAVALFHWIENRWMAARIKLIVLNFFLIIIFSAVNGLYAPVIKYIVGGAAAGRTDM